MKEMERVINLDNKKSKGTYCASLFIHKNQAVYFDSFKAVYFEYVPQQVLNKIRGKSITHNILRMQDNDFIMCRFYCIAFREYMLAGKTLLDYINYINDYKKNNKTIYKCFKETYVKFRV